MDKLKGKYSAIEWIKTIPKKTMGVFIVGLVFITGLSANAAIISGTVTDADTLGPLGGVTINVNNFAYFMDTTATGSYEIDVPDGCYQIVAHPASGDDAD